MPWLVLYCSSMFGRYELQFCPLWRTLKGNEPRWIRVAVRRRYTEKGIRKAWWNRVNSDNGGLFIYRMFDTKTGRVVEP